jgi:hypothetical protein
MSLLQCRDRSGKIAVGPFRELDQLQERVGHAAAGGEHDRFAWIP